MSPSGEHVAPPAGFEVRGEDDAPFFVGVGDDPGQEPGPVAGARADTPIRR